MKKLNDIQWTPSLYNLESLLHSCASASEIAQKFFEHQSEAGHGGSLWKLLHLFLRDATNESQGRYCGCAVMSNPLFALSLGIPDVVVMQHLAQTRPIIRRSIIAIYWLEHHFRDASPPTKRSNPETKVHQFIPEQRDSCVENELEASHFLTYLENIDRDTLNANADRGQESSTTWRHLLLNLIYPMQVTNIEKWFPYSTLVPLCGEYLHEGVLNEASKADSCFRADRQRFHIFTLLYDLSQNTSLALTEDVKKIESESDLKIRKKSRFYALLCGGVETAQNLYETWYKSTWACMRCHLILIQMRFSLQLRDAYNEHGLPYENLMSKYGGSDWLSSAEKIMVREFRLCLEQDSAKTDYDALVAKLLLAFVLQDSKVFSELVTLCGTRLGGEPTLSYYILHVLDRSFEEKTLTYDIQGHEHFFTTLRLFSRKSLAKAQHTTGQIALKYYETPLHHLCFIRDRGHRTNLLVEYFIASFRAAKIHLPLDEVDLLLQHISHTAVSLMVRKEQGEEKFDYVASSLTQSVVKHLLGIQTSRDSLWVSEEELNSCTKERVTEAAQWVLSSVPSALCKDVAQQVLVFLHLFANDVKISKRFAEALSFSERAHKKLFAPLTHQIDIERDPIEKGSLQSVKRELELWENFFRFCNQITSDRTLIALQEEVFSAEDSLQRFPYADKKNAYAILEEQKQWRKTKNELFALAMDITSFLEPITRTLIPPHNQKSLRLMLEYLLLIHRNIECKSILLCTNFRELETPEHSHEMFINALKGINLRDSLQFDLEFHLQRTKSLVEQTNQYVGRRFETFEGAK